MCYITQRRGGRGVLRNCPRLAKREFERGEASLASFHECHERAEVSDVRTLADKNTEPPPAENARHHCTAAAAVHDYTPTTVDRR